MRPNNSVLQGAFITALTHPSWTAERAGDNYQRLEFLGDGLIKAYVAALLYARFPEDEEGPLSKRLHHLVSRTTLAAAARSIGLDDREAGIGQHVRLGKSEAKVHAEALSDRLLEELFEAWVGATYLESGDPAARALVWAALEAVGLDMPEIESPKDLLQHRTQALVSDVPRYTATREPGAPDHAPRWRATVRLPRPLSGEATGVGDSKSAAEHAAARALLSDPGDAFTLRDASAPLCPVVEPGKNHRQQLKEWCDRSPGGPLIWSEVRDIGTVSTPRFEVTVTRGADEASGEGRNKTAAREAAAETLLRSLTSPR